MAIRVVADSTADLAEVFEQFPAGDTIICITVSSELSATYQSTKLGAELVERDDNPSDAVKLKELILDRFSPREVIINYMGSSIGTHGGRGSLAICF